MIQSAVHFNLCVLDLEEEEKMELENFLWGIFNGITAWPLLVLHVFAIWDKYPVYNVGRDSGWYQFGFLIGAGSPVAGILTGGTRFPLARGWRDRS